MSSVACPLCLTEVGTDQAFTCAGCKSKYHQDCAAEAGSCVVLGCKERQAQTKPGLSAPMQPTTSPEPEKARTTKKNTSLLKTYQTQILLIVALAGGAVLGYISGDTSGYQRGFSAGSEEGYVAGEAAGYTQGYSEGEDAGRRSGYNEGLTDGCEWVFEQAGYYAYVTAYNPFSYYNRYPGSNYISKSNC